MQGRGRVSTVKDKSMGSGGFYTPVHILHQVQAFVKHVSYSYTSQQHPARLPENHFNSKPFQHLARLMSRMLSATRVESQCCTRKWRLLHRTKPCRACWPKASALHALAVRFYHKHTRSLVKAPSVSLRFQGAQASPVAGSFCWGLEVFEA